MPEPSTMKAGTTAARCNTKVSPTSPRAPTSRPFKTHYFTHFRDGREREQLPDIAYIRVKPLWLRFSDFRVVPPRIVERRGGA